MNDSKHDQLKQSFDRFFSNHTKRVKVIIHAGTPKTGSTSLQFYLAKHFDQLLSNNILYSKNITKSYAPKHQWMVVLLNKGNLSALFDQIKKGILELGDTCHTLILSTEGIFNHWWDFSDDVKLFFGLLANYVKLHFWIWFREPISFMESYYIQALKNPQLEHIPIYGRDLSLKQCLDDDWFIKHLDYLGFIRDIQALSQDISIQVFHYQANSTIAQACQKLGVPYDPADELNKNVAIRASTVRALRVFNRQKLSIDEKTEAMNSMHELDRQNVDDSPFHCTVEEAHQIKAYFEPQRNALAAEFGIVFE